eukprot:4028674-Lingulodinium_polyedra.AAC.1
MVGTPTHAIACGGQSLKLATILGTTILSPDENAKVSEIVSATQWASARDPQEVADRLARGARTPAPKQPSLQTRSVHVCRITRRSITSSWRVSGSN